MVKQRGYGNGVLRLFSVSWAMLIVLLALFLKDVFPDKSLWLWTLSLAATCLLGIFYPSVMRGPYRAVEWLFAPVGVLVSTWVLALVFFGVFTPLATVLRLTGWDPLVRKRSQGGKSAWKERPVKVDDYYWQY